jgi:pentatricopeptide repeat protein
MHDLSNAGDKAARPDIVKYTTIISAYARSKNVTQTEAMLVMMLKDYLNGNELAKPDYKAFDIVISACTGWNNESNAGPFDACRAEAVLRRMWALHESGKLDGIQPKASIYKHIIICYKKSMNAGNAELLLRELDIYYKNGKLDEGPTKKLFQTVINAWHESARSDKQIHLQKLRVEMNERFGRKTSQNNQNYRNFDSNWK